MPCLSAPSRVLLAIGALTSILALACNPGIRGVRRDGGASRDAMVSLDCNQDADGDGIADAYEGRAEGIDTDLDATPDYQDPDSDQDGISDAVEGNPQVACGMPADSDRDGTPDFRDDDSDGNGIPDSGEPDADLDRDGDPDFRDLDDDGDALDDAVEMGGDPTAPLDRDRDGVPDYQDTDSDGDFIADLHESLPDTDRDGTPDRLDTDSDNDGWTDQEEAGDGDVLTPPNDSDMDGVANFRDPDSDDDGLSDRRERELNTRPDRADTDGDGVSDLVEVTACPAGDSTCRNDATNSSSSPRTRGDFVFFEPFEAPPMPTRDTLDFATDIRVADVYFLIDTTGSMGGAIANVRAGLSTAGSGIIDRVRATITDTFFGVGDFRDFGDPWTYRNVTDMTGSASTAQAGVNTLGAGGGGDTPEASTAALYATASGLGTGAIPPRTGCPAGTFGYPCFRDGAVPIVVLITDAPFHNGPGGVTYGGYTDYPTMLAAVRAARIRVIGISVGFQGGTSDLQAIARDSGAVDGAGSPLVSVTSDVNTVSSNVVAQIQTLASATRLDMSIRYEDDASDAVDSFAAFVAYIEANTAGDAARGCAGGLTAADTDSDGHPDTFQGVTAGTRVCFDIVVRQNVTVMPTREPQIFRATLRVIGDGFTELDSRDVYFLVPGVIPDPGGPD